MVGGISLIWAIPNYSSHTHPTAPAFPHTHANPNCVAHIGSYVHAGSGRNNYPFVELAAVLDDGEAVTGAIALNRGPTWLPSTTARRDGSWARRLLG